MTLTTTAPTNDFLELEGRLLAMLGLAFTFTVGLSINTALNSLELAMSMLEIL